MAPSDPSDPSNPSPTPYEKAILLIDHAHSLDPTITTLPSNDTIPYELHYAQKMTHYLSLRHPTASPILKVAIRAQHFRRWEIPRSSYPATKAGYFAWRTFLKKRQAEGAMKICRECGFAEEDVEEVGRLIRKEDLRGNEETQVLEDVACLVFLDDQFDEFEKGIEDEEKVIKILQKTWLKMSTEGRRLALSLEMSEKSRLLIEKALAGA